MFPVDARLVQALIERAADAEDACEDSRDSAGKAKSQLSPYCLWPEGSMLP